MKYLMLILLAIPAMLLTACPDVEDGAVRFESKTDVEVKAENVWIITDPQTVEKIRLQEAKVKTSTTTTDTEGKTTTEESETNYPE